MTPCLNTEIVFLKTSHHARNFGRVNNIGHSGIYRPPPPINYARQVTNNIGFFFCRSAFAYAPISISRPSYGSVERVVCGRLCGRRMELYIVLKTYRVRGFGVNARSDCVVIVVIIAVFSLLSFPPPSPYLPMNIIIIGGRKPWSIHCRVMPSAATGTRRDGPPQPVACYAN